MKSSDYSRAPPVMMMRPSAQTSQIGVTDVVGKRFRQQQTSSRHGECDRLPVRTNPYHQTSVLMATPPTKTIVSIHTNNNYISMMNGHSSGRPKLVNIGGMSKNGLVSAPDDVHGNANGDHHHHDHQKNHNHHNQRHSIGHSLSHLFHSFGIGMPTATQLKPNAADVQCCRHNINNNGNENRRKSSRPKSLYECDVKAQILSVKSLSSSSSTASSQPAVNRHFEETDLDEDMISDVLSSSAGTDPSSASSPRSNSQQSADDPICSHQRPPKRRWLRRFGGSKKSSNEQESPSGNQTKDPGHFNNLRASIRRSKTFSAFKLFRNSSGGSHAPNCSLISSAESSLDRHCSVNNQQKLWKSNNNLMATKTEGKMIESKSSHELHLPPPSTHKSAGVKIKKSSSMRESGLNPGEKALIASDTECVSTQDVSQGESDQRSSSRRIRSSASASFSSLFVSRLRKSQSVYDSSTSYRYQDFPCDPSLTVAPDDGSARRSITPATASTSSSSNNQTNPKNFSLQQTSMALMNAASRAVIRRRRSFRNGRRSQTNIGHCEPKTSSSSCTMDLISKRLSLPADLHLPAHFLAKIEKELETDGGNHQKQQQKPTKSSSQTYLSSVLRADPNQPINRKIRRESLNEIGFGRLETYTKLEKLGEGTYATVYKGRSHLTNQLVALKDIRFQQQEGTPCTAIREVSLLRTLKHNNIVTLHDVIYSEKHLILVFEYVVRDLNKYMTECRELIHVHNVKLFMFQMLRGLNYCHQRRILHRDIKPQNLLISERGELKLADFGLARSKSVPSNTLSNEVVTLWYRPPDVLHGSTHYTTSIDIWGAGCIFFELLSGEPMFRGMSDQDQLKLIDSAFGPEPQHLVTVPWEISRRVHRLNPIATDLMFQLLMYDPQKRIEANKAMRHAYFSTLNPLIHTLPDQASIFNIPTIVFYPDPGIYPSNGAPPPLPARSYQTLAQNQVEICSSAEVGTDSTSGNPHLPPHHPLHHFQRHQHPMTMTTTESANEPPVSEEEEESDECLNTDDDDAITIMTMYHLRTSKTIDHLFSTTGNDGTNNDDLEFDDDIGLDIEHYDESYPGNL